MWNQQSTEQYSQKGHRELLDIVERGRHARQIADQAAHKTYLKKSNILTAIELNTSVITYRQVTSESLAGFCRNQIIHRVPARNMNCKTPYERRR